VTLKHLTYLILNLNDLTGRCISYLIHFRKFQTLHLAKTRMSGDGARELETMEDCDALAMTVR
jgi:hypothetical protein